MTSAPEPNEILDSGDRSLYAVITHGPGPQGKLPLTAEMLLDRPSGDAFGMTEDAGIGWPPQTLAGPEAMTGGPLAKVRQGDRIRIVIDRNSLEGSVDLIGDTNRQFGPEEGTRILARRPPHPDLAPDPPPPRRNPPLGRAPAPRRRHLGRLRVRRGADHRAAVVTSDP